MSWFTVTGDAAYDLWCNLIKKVYGSVKLLVSWKMSTTQSLDIQTIKGTIDSLTSIIVRIVFLVE